MKFWYHKVQQPLLKYMNWSGYVNKKYVVLSSGIFPLNIRKSKSNYLFKLVFFSLKIVEFENHVLIGEYESSSKN